MKEDAVGTEQKAAGPTIQDVLQQLNQRISESERRIMAGVKALRHLNKVSRGEGKVSPAEVADLSEALHVLVASLDSTRSVLFDYCMGEVNKARMQVEAIATLLIDSGQTSREQLREITLRNEKERQERRREADAAAFQASLDEAKSGTQDEVVGATDAEASIVQFPGAKPE